MFTGIIEAVGIVDSLRRGSSDISIGVRIEPELQRGDIYTRGATYRSEEM